MSLFNKQLQLNVQEDINPQNISLELERLYTGLNKYVSEWESWTPSYSASGAMTYTTVTTTYARYCLLGNSVHFQIKALGTTGGVASTQLRFTVPIQPKRDTADGMGGGCTIIDGGAYRSGQWSHQGTTKTIAVARYDFANWGLAANTGFIITGFYEIDK